MRSGRRLTSNAAVWRRRRSAAPSHSGVLQRCTSCCTFPPLSKQPLSLLRLITPRTLQSVLPHSSATSKHCNGGENSLSLMLLQHVHVARSRTQNLVLPLASFSHLLCSTYTDFMPHFPCLSLFSSVQLCYDSCSALGTGLSEICKGLQVPLFGAGALSH